MIRKSNLSKHYSRCAKAPAMMNHLYYDSISIWWPPSVNIVTMIEYRCRRPCKNRQKGRRLDSQSVAILGLEFWPSYPTRPDSDNRPGESAKEPLPWTGRESNDGFRGDVWQRRGRGDLLGSCDWKVHPTTQIERARRLGRSCKCCATTECHWLV